MNDTLLDDIPKKFKNTETGEIEIAAMAQSYKELEKKFSNAPTIPKSHDEYCINCDHGFFDIDDATGTGLQSFQDSKSSLNISVVLKNGKKRPDNFYLLDKKVYQLMCQIPCLAHMKVFLPCIT